MTDLYWRKAYRIENRRLDGDTLDFEVDNGFFQFSRPLRLRVLGIDAPERYAAGGPEALDHSLQLLPVGRECIVQTYMDRDKYGRWLANIWLAPGVSYADEMVKDGHAVYRTYSINGSKAVMK